MTQSVDDNPVEEQSDMVSEAEAAQDPETAEAAPPSSEAIIAELEEKIKTLTEQNLRNLAELENFKKRKEQEVFSFKQYAAESFAKELLPVVDSFERAVLHFEKAEDKTELDAETKQGIQGFLMIQKQVLTALEKMGVKAMNAQNQPFDPHFHQAVSQVDAPDVKSDMVVDELQKGYLLHDRVLRPALVAVSK